MHLPMRVLPRVCTAACTTACTAACTVACTAACTSACTIACTVACTVACVNAKNKAVPSSGTSKHFWMYKMQKKNLIGIEPAKRIQILLLYQLS